MGNHGLWFASHSDIPSCRRRAADEPITKQQVAHAPYVSSLYPR